MKAHGYSVGISDLFSDNETNNKIVEVINQKMDVKSLIDETHLGIFENKLVNQMLKNLKFELIIF